jgi:tetratricopeptide (TPR) repeat protein
VIRSGLIERWPDGTSTRTFEFEREGDREAILDAVPVPRRAMLHRRVGGRLEAAYKTAPGDIAAQLAAHFERSGDYDRALAHHYAAGVVARRRSAPEVASKHFRRALALVQSLPLSKQRDLREADLLVAIGRELIISEGLNSDAASDAYRRAMELQEGVDDGPILSRTLWGLWVYHLNCGPLENAQRVADRLFELAQACGDPEELLQAHHALWGTSLMLGNVNAVLEHTRKGIALCATEADVPLKLTTGCMFHDVHLHDHAAAVCAGFIGAWADVLAGRKDMAAQNLNAAISHARDMGHPFNLAVALVLAASAMAAANDPGVTRRFAEEGRIIAEFEAFGLLIAWASIYEGWALARLGEEEKGLDKILGGLEVGREVGMTLFRPFQLALAAEVQLQSGKLDDAARSLEEALLISERRGDRLAVPELYRLRGELRMRTASSAASRRSAVSDLGMARDIATELGATLMAARASASLERLQARQPG